MCNAWLYRMGGRMSLIVEDGTGLSTAESYGSVADADTYHANIGNTTWGTLTTAVKEQLLRKATNYMIQTYRMRWAGVRKNDTQALDWPRFLVPRLDTEALYAYYDSDSVPGEVKVACFELALKANSAALAPDTERLTKREKVGQLEVEYDTVNGKAYKMYRAIDNLLMPMMDLGKLGMMTKLDRA